MAVEISVIIPTFNRWNILLQCISALKEQTLDPSSYEVIVIDDGSTDKAYKTFISPNLRYLHQEKKGPASARNLGIRQARGRILVFLGDDIIASKNLLEEHLCFHKEKFQGENFACLGYITWPREFQTTQFLHFMGNWGQFLFEEISHEEELNYNYFYTSNISLKKIFLDKKNLFFDENFKDAAWEDIELGYRLEKEGLKIIFNRNATSFHNHYPTFESAINRMETSGKSLLTLLKKWPELSKGFGFLRTENALVLRNKLIKKILRNKLSIKILTKTLKFFDKTIIPQQEINNNQNLRDILTPHKGFPEEKPGKLLKEIYKNILLYYLQKGFEEEQKNWQV